MKRRGEVWRGAGKLLRRFPRPSPIVILLPFLKMPWLSPAPPEEAAEATREGGRLGNREARPARDAKENRKGRTIPRRRGNLRPAGAPRRRDAPGSGGARPCGAAPDSGFTHIAINTKVHLGATQWYEPVTDEEYNNK